MFSWKLSVAKTQYSFSTDPTLRGVIGEMHGTLASILFVLLGLHVGGARFDVFSKGVRLMCTQLPVSSSRTLRVAITAALFVIPVSATNVPAAQIIEVTKNLGWDFVSRPGALAPPLGASLPTPARCPGLPLGVALPTLPGALACPWG